MDVWVSEDLIWSHHVLKTTKRASKLIGLIYRRYYMSSSQGTYFSCISHLFAQSSSMLRLFGIHITPATSMQALEKVQRFALRMSAKLWDHDYDKLLLLFGLPTLESRRKILNLCYLAGCHPLYTPSPPNQGNRQQAKKLQYLVLPFTRTRSYQHSFFPHAVKLWNELPPDTKSCPSLLTFKRHLKNIFT